jgi:hypothetical protein
MQVLRRKDDAEREERGEQHDRVQRALELTPERAEMERARAGVELEEDGV